MKKTKLKLFVKICVFIFLLSLIIIAYKEMIPISKAEKNDSIIVVYKSGNDDNEEKTFTQSVFQKQTKGANDYTNNKIIFKDNLELNFNEGEILYSNGHTYDKVLTGWKLTAVYQNGNKITTFKEPENQNYANPKDAKKDIGTVYAQGGWYIVPEGVSKIEVTAVYGRAIYIRSPYDKMFYDEYHIWYYGENNDGVSTLTGTPKEKSSDSNFGTSKDDAVATLKRAYELITPDSSLTVCDTVFLLCGDFYEINYNTAGNSYAKATGATAGTYKNYSNTNFGYNTNSNKPVTITSELGKKYNMYMICPLYDYSNYASLRLDNINLYNLPDDFIKDIHENSITISTYTRARQFRFYNYSTLETTENFISASQSSIWLKNARSCRLNGGLWQPIFEYNVVNANVTLTKGNYYKVGGLAKISFISTDCQYNSGTNEYFLTNPATLIITGGQVTTGVYGTGYAEGGSVKGNVNIFISGGKIANIYGAGYGSTYSNGTENGDVNIIVYSADIGTIYGGGQFYTSKVSGNVNINVYNSTITGNVFGGGKGRKSSWKC